MAETKRGRKPKTKVINDIIETNEDIKSEFVENNNDDLIQQLMAQIAEQNEKMIELQAQVENNKNQPVVIQSDNRSSAKKIKVINLMNNPLNISTEPNGMGRVYNFKEYGESRLIKFDDLTDIVASYPYTMEHGLAYICDKNAVDELGLSDEYNTLFGKETMDKVIWLRTDIDLELFLGMDKNLQESTAIKIAELINANEKMDYNYLRTIKERTGIDIESIANDLKDRTRKPSDEE